MSSMNSQKQGSRSGLFGSTVGSSSAKIWKPLGPTSSFPPINTSTLPAKAAFAGPPGGSSTLVDTAIAKLLPGTRLANSFVRDILSAEEQQNNEREQRGRRGRPNGRSGGRRTSLGVRSLLSPDTDSSVTASATTLADGDFYDSFRQSFPHLLPSASSGAPPSSVGDYSNYQGSLSRRSKSVPRQSPASLSVNTRYSEEDDGGMALSDETRGKIRKHTAALSNVCRILTDLLELREVLCNDADDLEDRKEELEDELEGLDDEDENGAISEKKIHVRFELERVQHDLDQTVRSLIDIDERLTEIGEETVRFEKRVRSIKAGPLAAREDGSSLADDEDDFSARVITLEGHTDSVECVDFDEPWRMLVTGSADSTVRIWDLSSQHQWALLRGHTGSVNALHLLGQQLLTASSDNTVRYWDISKIPTLPVHWRSQEPFFISEEGQEDKESICVVVLEGHSAAVNCVQGDGEIVVSGSSDSTIRTWDMYANQCTAILQPGQDDSIPALKPGASAADISFTGWGGNGSAMSGLNRTPRKPRKKGGPRGGSQNRQQPQQQHPGSARKMDSDVVLGFELPEEAASGLPPSTSSSASSSREQSQSKLRFGSVSFLEDESEDYESEPDFFDGFQGKKSASTPRASRLNNNGDSLPNLWASTSPAPPAKEPSYFDVEGPSPFAREPAAALLHSSRIPSRLPAAPAVPVDTYGHVAALQFWKHALASGHGDGVVRLWDLRQNECTRELRGHLGAVTSLQFDEHSIVTSSSDNTIRVWDLRKGDATDEIKVDEPVVDVRFDESKIYLAGGIPQIRVYNRLSGKIKLMSGHSSPQGHKAPTRCVRFMGRMLVSGSMDSTAKVWQI